MKICVIGNSHVAAVKLAYEALPPQNPYKMTFFAGLGRKIGRFEITDGKLSPPVDDSKTRYAIGITSGGLKEINPALYDRFLIIGMSGGVKPLVSTATRPLSTGAKNCAITEYWQASPLAPLLSNLRLITGKPISVGFAPLLAEDKKNDKMPEGYTALVALSNSLFFAPQEVTLIGQPLESITNGDATEIEFSRLSEKLLKDEDDFGIHHPEGENSHMNKSYGTLWLQKYFASLDAENGR